MTDLSKFVGLWGEDLQSTHALGEGGTLAPTGAPSFASEINLRVEPISGKEATRISVQNHYLHRKSSVVHAFALITHTIEGVVIFGVPGARHLQMGACPSNPDAVLELNRLWLSDAMPRNSESWFISRALSSLPPSIVVSYADTTRGHMGYVYRAANFHYAGWTDMERKTPRYDYLAPGKHTRDAFRNGLGAHSEKVRRKPKVKYWTVTGNPKERRNLRRLCGWPILDWKVLPPPTEHQHHKLPLQELREAVAEAKEGGDG